MQQTPKRQWAHRNELTEYQVWDIEWRSGSLIKEAITMSDMSYAEIRERVTYEFTELEYVGDACEKLIDYLQ
ncbi:LOW QUALITY PROTEIN: hypothetical protein PHPALM_3895 [Phytophthora palmivora]|uniref:Uncharacterized protein n=1 Tax=Phytophthora palmivora TaxID=4796 RepID=A0A2P4YLA0_9STRA|nr:LOW QUALITY PROTEIN: hypothetical protein PHPALM_3895 [Phytophthora palmivora]